MLVCFSCFRKCFMLYFITSGINNPSLVGVDMMVDRKIPIEKFNETYYGFGRCKSKITSTVKICIRPLAPNQKAWRSWNLLGNKAMNVVRLSLSRNITFQTTKAKTTWKMMKILSEMCEKLSTPEKDRNKQRLKKHPPMRFQTRFDPGHEWERNKRVVVQGRAIRPQDS